MQEPAGLPVILTAVGGAIATIIAAVWALVNPAVKRVFEHTIPRLAEDFKTTNKELRGDFLTLLGAQEKRHQESLAQARSDFREMLRDINTEQTRALAELRGALDSLARRQDGGGRG